MNISHFFLARFCLGSSTSKFSISTFLFVPRQLPVTEANLIEFTTRRVWIDCIAWITVGLSLTWSQLLPDMVQPKNFSRGSWLSLTLKKTATPGSFKILLYGVNSRKDETEIDKNYNGKSKLLYLYSLPVMFIPARVSLLSIILLFSVSEKPSLFSTLSSHALKYPINSSRRNCTCMQVQ